MDKTINVRLNLGGDGDSDDWSAEDSLSHAICMGIRHGIYGANAPGDSSPSGMYGVETSLTEIARALYAVADAINKK